MLPGETLSPAGGWLGDLPGASRMVAAPASEQARAMVVMSVTSGESLANTGIRVSLFRFTAWITPEAATGSQANTCPRSSTLGHEMLTSIIATPG